MLSNPHPLGFASETSDSFYRDIVEGTAAGIWLVDANAETTFVNARMAELLGYTVQSMIGVPLYAFMADAERVIAADRLGHRAPQQYELVLQHKDGAQVWMQAHSVPLRDPEGRDVGTSTVLVAKSNPQTPTDTVEDPSQERLRAIAESLPHMIWTAGTDKVCDFQSRRWATYTGLPVAQLLGWGWGSAIHPDDLPGLSKIWAEASAEGPLFRAEFRVRRHDGVYRWFEAVAAPHRDAGGAVVCWVGTTSDIDDRRKAEQARAESQKREALGTLAGGIAHDFNNMLMVIVTAAEELAEMLPVGDERLDRVSEIAAASSRAAALVRSILSFSRPGEGQQRPVDLSAVFTEAVLLAESTLPKNIELDAHLPNALPLVLANPTQIFQVVMNLVINASHAIGARGGVIELSVCAVDVDAAHARRTPELHVGRYVRVDVRDNGAGMDESIRARIFDPFFTTKPARQGTGLGLSIVAGIMQAHDGAIEVESEPNKGSLFAFYLPVAAEVAAVELASTGATLPPQVRADGKLILYVDDHPTVLSLAVEGLKRQGYEVIGCSDPSVAMRYFREQPAKFAAVVSDFAMPTLSGVDLARQVLALKPDVPFILVSGFLSAEETSRAVGLGVRAVYFKPIKSRELALAIERLL